MRRRICPTGVRFLTFSCYRRLNLLGNPRIRDALAREIFAARAKCGFRLQAWVIMPEHVHLVLAAADPEWPVERILPQIKAPFAQNIIGRWRKLGVRGAGALSKITDGSGRVRFWQPGGGFDRAARNIDKLVREGNYVHRNPVKRGLAACESGWKWSSAHEYIKLRAIAAKHGWRSVGGAPERASVLVDSAHVDRFEFPEQALGSIWIDGKPCAELVVRTQGDGR